jgi:hypothetical protein
MTVSVLLNCKKCHIQLNAVLFVMHVKIFSSDVGDFSCGCFLFSCFFPFDILFVYILFSFENESSLPFGCFAILVE